MSALSAGWECSEAGPEPPPRAGLAPGLRSPAALLLRYAASASDTWSGLGLGMGVGLRLGLRLGLGLGLRLRLGLGLGLGLGFGLGFGLG